MKKVRKVGGGVVNIWSLKEKFSGMTFVNPNIPALKYGRAMEIEAVNTFAEYITNHVVHWVTPRSVNVMFVLW